MYSQNKHYLRVAAFVIVLISLLIGAAVGGFAGYLAAAESAPTSQTTLTLPIPETPPDNLELIMAGNPARLMPPDRQTLIITEESALVESVDAVLPSVVTVLNMGGPRGAGSGTGFFISSEGHVVTNNHVIENAERLMIVYSTGGTAPATLVGAAPDFDLAVLQVDGPVPAVAAWGDSGELPLGSSVIAIGSALGQYQNTVTAGILSGFNRRLGPLHGLLQTDAAINQGNSGGPLVNLGGQVIGINTLIVRGRFAQAEGLGFAIPSNIARTVVTNLIETGEVRKPFLGVQYQELNPWLAIQEDIPTSQGALLQDVLEGAPANLAGLEAGDIIVSVNGQQVDDRHPLVSLLLEHVAGETITIEVQRDGEIFQTTITLAEQA